MQGQHTPNTERDGVEVGRDQLIALGRVSPPATLTARRRVITPLAGNHASRQHGPGMAFSEVRAYQPGDDIRSIDWRVTARTGRAHSKIFEAERERPLWLAVDLSTSMRFATRGAFKSVLAARTAAAVAWDAFRSGERVGAVIWSPQSTFEIPIGRTRRHLMKVLGTLADATSEPGREDPGDALEPHVRWLRDRVRTGSRVAVVSDFYDLSDGALGVLRSLAGRCELRLFWIYDAIEAAPPPPGRYRVSDGTETDVLVARNDRRWQEAYRATFDERATRLERFSRETGAALERISTAECPVPALTLETGGARA